MSELEQRIAGLPIWRGRPRLEPLIGGLSNISYVVSDAAGKYVVRAGRDFPFHHVLREREVMAARAAHAAGFAPEIVYAEHGLMVSRFVEGRVFTEADMRANVGRVADFIRRFHDEMPHRVTGPAQMFWVFHVVRDYARALGSSPNPLAARLPGLLEINADLEAAQVPLPIRFGHHDLLPANFIDDGARLWLIDFEYAGFGTAMFDLAGIASNAAFGPEEARALLETYFGDTPSERLWLSFAAMAAASLREALWALVSEIHLNAPGADYDAYARQNFARFEVALAAYRALHERS